MKNDYNVFLCYRGEGSVLASSIYHELNTYSKDKLKLFYAPKCLAYGENFMSSCKEIAGQVSLVILILTPKFFEMCSNADDVVYQELKSALANPLTSFLPITTPGFEYNDEAMQQFFNEQEIDRIKHISAIKYTDVYSFNSIDLLLPIVKDKVGVTDYEEIIQNAILSRQKSTKKRVHINQEEKVEYFSQENKSEANRLNVQQQLLLNFDMPIYEKYLSGKTNLKVLDIGCGNGKALMKRLDRQEVDKIIGVEFNQSFVDKANQDFASDKAKFYKLDVESQDFIDDLQEIMEENDIEKFDWINILAVMSHLKSPYHLLKAVRKVCKKDAVIFIRNIDDGLNMAYPDPDFMFERAFDMIAKCDTTGYRRSGRELYTLLTRSGYKNISVEKFGLNTADMDYSEKEAYFDTIFKFLKNGINQTAKNNPTNKEILAERDWLEDKFDELEEAFLSSETFINFGFLIVVARV